MRLNDKSGLLEGDYVDRKMVYFFSLEDVKTKRLAPERKTKRREHKDGGAVQVTFSPIKVQPTDQSHSERSRNRFSYMTTPPGCLFAPSP